MDFITSHFGRVKLWPVEPFWTLFSTYLSSKLDSPLTKTLERENLILTSLTINMLNSVQLVRVSIYRNDMSLFSQINFLSLFVNSWVNLIRWTTYFVGKKPERWFLEFVCFSFFHFWLLRRSYWPLNKIMWLLCTIACQIVQKSA